MFGGAKPDRVGGIGVALRFRKREMLRLRHDKVPRPRSIWDVPFSAVSSRTLRPSAQGAPCAAERSNGGPVG